MKIWYGKLVDFQLTPYCSFGSDVFEGPQQFINLVLNLQNLKSSISCHFHCQV